MRNQPPSPVQDWRGGATNTWVNRGLVVRPENEFGSGVTTAIPKESPRISRGPGFPFPGGRPKASLENIVGPGPRRERETLPSHGPNSD